MLTTPEIVQADIPAINNLTRFVKFSMPNTMFVYYRGPTLIDNAITKEIKDLSYKYAQAGLIYLVIKRFDTNLFDFIAIKASNPPVIKLVPLSDAQYKEKYGQ